MIILFTSSKCTWCDVVKGMLDEVLAVYKDLLSIYEVNIEQFQFITKAYGIAVVPTLVSKRHVISGVPDMSDLESFLLQAAVETPNEGPPPREIISSIKKSCPITPADFDIETIQPQ